ncbi:energy transducer TonB [Pedobacter alpinus]|uniref:Energy transducer TonB n=1 Tax=Pedobacter alpinus TaxID=1590643 RepID=A0ABW5TV31_9SPHI
MLFSKTDVNKVEWLNLVFENRNQLYGAYVLRKESGNYLFKALIISGFLFSGVILGSVLFSNLNAQDAVVYDVPPAQPDVVKVDPIDVITPKIEPKTANNKKTPPMSKPAENLQEVKIHGIIKPSNNPLINNELPTIKQIDNSVIGVNNTAGENTDSNMGNTTANTNGGNGLEGNAGEGETIYNVGLLEVMPEFPGGMAAWAKFLNKNLRYPAEARDNNITGKVLVSFVVERNGEITDLKVLRGIGGGCDEEAMRVIKKSPFWKPGIQNGRAVRVSYVMPIVFRVE